MRKVQLASVYIASFKAKTKIHLKRIFDLFDPRAGHGLVSSRKDACFSPFESMRTTALRKKGQYTYEQYGKVDPAGGSINKDMCVQLTSGFVN